jgi:hypothetical protein
MSVLEGPAAVPFGFLFGCRRTIPVAEGYGYLSFGLAASDWWWKELG